MQVNTLAGLSTMDGTKLQKEAMEVTRDERFRMESKWPNQKRPTPQERGLWKAELQKLAMNPHTDKLRRSLGRWIEHTQDKWEWYVDKRPRLYQRTEEGWDVYVQVGQHTNECRGHYEYSEENETKPGECKRALVKVLSPTKVKCIAIGITRNDTQTTNEELDESTRYILENWSVTYGTEQELAQKLRQGKLLVVSDGSYFPESRRAAFQVRMETEDGLHKAQLQ